MALMEALAHRDAPGMERLLGQWVHRHGHPALQALLLELQQADPEGMAWWQGGAEPAVVPPPVIQPTAELQPKPELQPKSERQPNPELARLRSWLPDRVERRRAA
jgi:hypothetical protein